MAYVLLTGSTGLVGGYLLRNLLRRGVRVAVVVRPTTGADVRRRIETTLAPLEEAEQRAVPRPVILSGELHAPGLGLNEQDRKFFREQCDSVLHSAASIEFYRNERSDEPNRTNILGLRNLLELSREAGIARFHHVSTAYIAGLRGGRVLETESDVGQSHGNDYERSKLAGEKMVGEAGFPERPTFYRPSIVMGDSRTGFTTTYNGFYTPLQLAAYLHKQGEISGDWQAWYLSQLGLTGGERKNLVPVDWVAESITQLFLRPETHGRTYHLTNPHPPTAEQLTRVMQRAITAQVKPVTKGSPRSDLATAGAEFQRYMANYRAYFRDDPVFDDSLRAAALPHLPCPATDEAFLERAAHFALKTNFTPPRFAGEPLRVEFADQIALCERIDPLESVPGNYLFSLTGRGGNDTTISIDSTGRVSVLRGVREPIAAETRLRFDLWRKLVAEAVSVPAALARGKIVITGSRGGIESAERLLESLRKAANRSAENPRRQHESHTAVT